MTPEPMDRSPMACEVCGKGPEPKRGSVTIYRMNAPGQMPPHWRCSDHLTRPVDPTIQKIVKVLNG